MLRKLSYVESLCFWTWLNCPADRCIGNEFCLLCASNSVVPYKDQYDNYLKTATELQLFVAIATALALKGGSRRQLEQEKITPDFTICFS